MLPPEGEAGEVEWTLQLEAGAPPIKASFNARNYRKMLKDLDANPAGVMLMLQGYLACGASGLYLEKAGFRVERKMSRPPQGAPAPKAPSPRGPVVESVRRLK